MPAEIVYCNLTVLYQKKGIRLKEVVYKETNGYYDKKKLFPEPVQVIRVDVIKSLGFEAGTK